MTDNRGSGSLRFVIILAVVIAITMTVAFFSLGWARWPLSSREVLDVLLGGGSAINRRIVLEFNLPRVVMAVFVGAGLAISGTVMQALFRNPMASPYILGVSSGASLGAAVGMLFTIPFIPQLIATPLLAFVFCFGTMMLVYSLSRVGGSTHVETLLLSGIAVGAFISAIVSFLTFIAGDKMEGIVFWSMGSLGRASPENLLIVIPVVIAGLFIMLMLSKELNALMLGDAHAMDLGVDVGRTRLVLLVCTTAVTAVSVAFVGVIGFVGLVIPHIIRMLIGPDNRMVIPLSIFAGAAYLVICDYMAHAFSGSVGVIPIGIITALIGGPYFIYLLRRRRHQVGWT